MIVAPEEFEEAHYLRMAGLFIGGNTHVSPLHTPISVRTDVLCEKLNHFSNLAHTTFKVPVS